MSEPSLTPELEERLRQVQADLWQRNQLLSTERLQACYAAFRERFGPDRLRDLDGEALLNTMHAHGNKESLVYWLEFKDDEEFPAAFGSIAGGSALKFGLYLRNETGTWMTGSPRDQVPLSVPEAIEIARTHRSQLLAGSALIASLPDGSTDEDYRRLQENIEEVAPGVADSAWGHKYFALLYPTKLDDFHSPQWQRFHLIKLLQEPPQKEGRFSCAGRYVALASKLGLPMNHLTRALNEMNGRPHRYWRVGTRLSPDHSIWPLMRSNSSVAVGWDYVTDQSALTRTKEGKDHLRGLLEHRVKNPQQLGKETQQLFNFVTAVQPDDIILACDGQRVLGIGRAAGLYSFDASGEVAAPHRRPVVWLSQEEWKMPVPEGLQTTVHELNKSPQNLIEVERRILGATDAPPSLQPLVGTRDLRLSGVPGRLQGILERKGQAILYGPPGTGKTHWAQITALNLASVSAFAKPYDELVDAQRMRINGGGAAPALVRFCTFHPAYGYEDFLEGFRPTTSGGAMAFERRDGIFKRLCEDAQKEPGLKHFLVIDEINRGDIPRIFGELLTLLEVNKRAMEVELPLSGHRFSVPGNVFVIGTMNTADRSIAVLDTALRRRFGFVELMPDSSLLKDVVLGGGLPLGPWLTELNGRIRAHVGRDARNLQIGHAFFLRSGGAPITGVSDFVRVLAEDIVPLLEEYCYDDYSALARVLGQGLVDEGQQRVRAELLEPLRWTDLLQALLAPSPQIATSIQASATEADGESDESGAGVSDNVEPE